MRNIYIGFIAGIIFSSLLYGLLQLINVTIGHLPFVSPISKTQNIVLEKPLEKYSFEQLRSRQFAASAITFGKTVKKTSNTTSYLFYFESEGKKVSGLANIPDRKGTYPVLVLLRGYVEKEIYTSGVGTSRSGEAFSQNGFITLAPDFLGYGESASESADPIESRFENYTIVLNLLASIKRLNEAFSASVIKVRANDGKVALWGHSNGGHIALATLEITGKPYPTSLWAPVSKPYPYSVLYYTDEFDDYGKWLRKIIANFEKEYEADKYSITNYFDWITAPIQLHQGIADEAVPLRWSDQLNNILKEKDKQVTYYTYPGADHNFAGGSWSTVVARDVVFFKEKLADK